MSPVLHLDRAPDIPRLLATLEMNDLRYVLVGSVAASLYGVAVQPGDLDIAPAFDDANVRRLAALLIELEATPAGAGRWEIQPDGERKWIEEPLTEAEQATRATAWAPRADDLSTFDYLFRTRYGNFDVVPETAGRYDDLMARAVRLQAADQTIWTAHIDDLLSTLTVPRRKKDVTRVQALRAIQRWRGAANEPA